MYENKSNSRSTAIGYAAMLRADNQLGAGRETFNTAVGYQALLGSLTPANNTGRRNTAVGDRALWSNSTGDDNTAVGLDALVGNVGGYDNTAIGLSTLRLNSTGYSNTAVGKTALQETRPGSKHRIGAWSAILQL
ncbi:MAG: hypothetical protein IPH31_07255 [Lewinellaceae bacterium]|nr:hypothetical protein [Lewinellaceae bacterium]